MDTRCSHQLDIIPRGVQNIEDSLPSCCY